MSDLMEDIKRGDTFRALIQKNARNPETGQLEPIDLTGFTFTFSLSFDLYGAPFYVGEFKAGDNKLDKPESGEMWIVIPDEVTSTFEVGKCYYELQMETNAGDIFTVMPSPDNYKDRIRILPDLRA